MSNQFSNVLIVEENKNIAQRLCRILAQSGFRVFQAISENEALNSVIDESIGCIFLNLSSRKLDYQRFIGNLRQSRLPSLIVGLVSEKDEQKALGAIRQGIFDYITKPIKQQRVSLVLEDVLERSENLTSRLSEKFKKLDTIVKHMDQLNYKQYRNHLIKFSRYH